jgi:hypothetical protein
MTFRWSLMKEDINFVFMEKSWDLVRMVEIFLILVFVLGSAGSPFLSKGASTTPTYTYTTKINQ